MPFDHLIPRTATSKTRSRMKWVLLTVLWSCIGGIFVGRYVVYTLFADDTQFEWMRAFWVWMGWVQWIVLTPLVLYLARRFPIERASWQRHARIHVVGWLVVTLVDTGLYVISRSIYHVLVEPPTSPFWEGVAQLFASTLSVNLFVYFGIIAAVQAWSYYKKYQERESQAAKLEGQLAKAQLKALKMQLHPHFLFNTLHAISALMDEDVKASRDMLAMLSQLLRLTLENADKQEVSLKQEIAFLKHYLEIQQIRFRDQLEVSFDVDPEVLQAQVPNMILQPLVENALDHGAAHNGDASRVAIRGYRTNGSLVMEVQDNGPGLASPNVKGLLTKGIGLRNTQERLEQLYGTSQRLAFQEPTTGGTQVSVKIPFYTQADTIAVVE